MATSGSAGKVFRRCAQKNDTLLPPARDFGEIPRAKNHDFGKKKSTKIVGTIFPQENNLSTKRSRRATKNRLAGSYRTVLHKKLTQSLFLGTVSGTCRSEKPRKIVKNVILDFGLQFFLKYFLNSKLIFLADFRYLS